jgi:hypothetical protein
LFGDKAPYAENPQVIIERNRLKIIDVQEAKGSEHDFKVYKDTRGTDIGNSIPLDIEAYHANSFIQATASKKHQLTGAEKAYTKELSGRRVVIDRSNAKIKTFRCMSYSYRGHYHNRHALRMTLICGLINYDRMV